MAQSDRLVMANNAEAAAVFGYLDPLPDPVLVLDPTLGIHFANRAARVLFPSLDRLTVGEPLARHVRQPVALSVAERAFSKQSAEPVEPRKLSLPGTVERRFEVRAVRLNNAAGIDAGQAALLLFHEETAAWRAEQMRVDFIANASHELRTPIASLMGYIETMQGPARDDPEAQEQFLGIMADQARRMSRLIDDLMSLSRIELDEHMAPQEHVRIAEIVSKSCDVVVPMADQAGVEIVNKMPFGAADAFVMGDEDELVQVLQNLLDNAVKYGGDGGRVELSGVLRDETDQVVLRVRDFGAGIPEEHLPRLTERFYRVDTKASRARGGTGLGLAIVKHIVNRHKGRLRIESKPGEGSLFEFTLPLARLSDDEDDDDVEIEIIQPMDH